MKGSSYRARRGARKAVALLASAALGLAVSLLVLLVWNPDRAWAGLLTILRGNPESLLRAAAPLWLAGLSVGLAYRAGLFNLGSPGQMLVGGFAALFVGMRWPLTPAPLLCLIACACAALAGGLWGGFSGLFQADGGADEALASLLLNFVGWFGVRFLIAQTPGDALALGAPAWAALPGVAPVLALAALAIVHVLLWHTTLGYEFRAVGLNPAASQQAGLPVRKARTIAMILAGALAGLGGALWALSSETGLRAETLEPLALQGVAGLAVAWFGLAHPLGILVSGLFLAHLGLGVEAWAALDRVPEHWALLLSFLLYGAAMFPWILHGMIRRRARRPAIQAPEEVPEPAAPEPPAPEPTETHAEEKTPDEVEAPPALPVLEPAETHAEENAPDGAEAPPVPPPSPHMAKPLKPAPDDAEKEGENG